MTANQKAISYLGRAPRLLKFDFLHTAVIDMTHGRLLAARLSWPVIKRQRLSDEMTLYILSGIDVKKDVGVQIYVSDSESDAVDIKNGCKFAIRQDDVTLHAISGFRRFMKIRVKKNRWGVPTVQLFPHSEVPEGDDPSEYVDVSGQTLVYVVLPKQPGSKLADILSLGARVYALNYREQTSKRDDDGTLSIEALGRFTTMMALIPMSPEEMIAELSKKGYMTKVKNSGALPFNLYIH